MFPAEWSHDRLYPCGVELAHIADFNFDAGIPPRQAVGFDLGLYSMGKAQMLEISIYSYPVLASTEAAHDLSRPCRKVRS